MISLPLGLWCWAPLLIWGIGVLFIRKIKIHGCMYSLTLSLLLTYLTHCLFLPLSPPSLLSSIFYFLPPLSSQLSSFSFSPLFHFLFFSVRSFRCGRNSLSHHRVPAFIFRRLLFCRGNKVERGGRGGGREMGKILRLLLLFFPHMFDLLFSLLFFFSFLVNFFSPPFSPRSLKKYALSLNRPFSVSYNAHTQSGTTPLLPLPFSSSSILTQFPYVYEYLLRFDLFLFEN